VEVFDAVAAYEEVLTTSACLFRFVFENDIILELEMSPNNLEKITVARIFFRILIPL
jgi:hypothetical protein